MNAIYVSLINDSLTEFVYPATLGGLDYELSPLFYGVQVENILFKTIHLLKIVLVDNQRI